MSEQGVATSTLESKETIVIDPRGDVFLVCTTNFGNTRIQVSSYVLSLCSPVFRSMLQPHFKEGNTLATSSTVEIPLPHDDGYTMTEMCRVLHHRNSDVFEDMTSDDILEIALLADKYDCTDALEFSSERWIRVCARCSRLGERRQLLVAAYHFECKDMFEKISKDLVLMTPGKEWSVDEAKNDSDGFEKVFAFIEHKRRTVAEALSKMLENIVDEHFVGVDSDPTSRCVCTELVLVDTLRQMKSKEIWPVSVMHSRELRYSFNILKKFSLAEFNCAKCPSCICRIETRSRPEKLSLAIRDRAKKIKDTVWPVCYRCFKDGQVCLQTFCEH